MNKPLLDCSYKRGAGVLLHPSSFPNHLGIGNFGASAYHFIDFLEAAGMRYWQICPLGPTGYGDSPYQCFSTFALNPYFLDLEYFVQQGFLTTEDTTTFVTHYPERVDYAYVYEKYWPLAKKAYTNWNKKRIDLQSFITFDAFCSQEAYWLEDYALFMMLKNHFLGKSWLQWDNYKIYQKKQINTLSTKQKEELDFHRFIQYHTYGQWYQLKSYANQKKIQIIGDMPIFVALDSADVWSHTHLFELDEHKHPLFVAGVPPDYFSPKGQLWGNPLYRWEAHRLENYQWWISRLQKTHKLYDITRLDHFRGFESYWAIPAHKTDAILGQWLPGPGLHFFENIQKFFDTGISLIAEDLGIITPGVRHLLESIGLPGMVVQQFGFGDTPSNTHLSHNYIANQVVYTGTHDNDTSWGWYRQAGVSVQKHVCEYLNINGQTIPWDLIRNGYKSVCNIAIAPLQDYLSLGSTARMNTPGKPYNNWTWRYTHAQLHQLWKESAGYLHHLGSLYGRLV